MVLLLLLMCCRHVVNVLLPFCCRCVQCSNCSRFAVDVLPVGLVTALVLSNQLSFFCDRFVVDLLLICCCCVVPEVHLLSICCGAAHDELLIVLHRFVVDLLSLGCRCAVVDLSCV